MAESHFDDWIARHYETLWPELFDPAVVEPVLNLLADLAGSGAALELGIGTGPIGGSRLSQRGVPVHGIELTPAMIAQLRAHEDASSLGVTLGDMATTTVDGSFDLVYLLRNTITNLTSQAEQVACFGNAATHLEPGGVFVIENYIPELRRMPPGQTTHVFAATPAHIGVGEYDVVNQIEVSRHWWVVDGELRTFSSPFRYVWPSELDLMATSAGLALRDRWGGRRGEPFTADSRSHVSVWEKAGQTAQ